MRHQARDQALILFIEVPAIRAALQAEQVVELLATMRAAAEGVAQAFRPKEVLVELVARCKVVIKVAMAYGNLANGLPQ